MDSSVVMVVAAAVAVATFVVMACRIRRDRDALGRYRQLAAASREGLLFHREGAVVDVNERLCGMLGFSREELVGGDGIALTLAPESREEAKRHMAGKRPAVYEVILMKRNGTRLPCEVFSREDATVAGGVRIVSLHDISARKAAEAALHAVQDELEALNAALERRVEERTLELERANRTLLESNAELEAFSFSISHDLRTPLRGIDGMSLALAEEYSARLDDTGRDYLNRVRSGVQRMGRIMDDITHLSRVNRVTIKYETVDLGALAAEVIAGLRVVSPGRSVEFVCAEDATACGDRKLLRVLLENLLGNAWKYTGRTGHAVIEFGYEDADETWRRFYVRDNGAGFEAKYKDKLFTAFMRLHGPHEFEGSGLGLAIVSRVMRRHGGTVDAHGEPGHGATFGFSLHPTCDTGEYV